MKKLTFKHISMFLYVVSLGSPIFFGAGVIGIFGLLLGLIGMFEFDIYIFLPWLANILYFFNLVFEKKINNLKIPISILTIIFGLFTFGISRIPLDEGGAYANVKPGIGFGIWILSFTILLLGQLKNKNVG
ncbi:hypothetical protein D2V93_16635 [Flagellimonas taeanensis]|uniref:hypothetical protein n=1 Tax=Flavobacteriaceae TaxID=49546 RepID=UPI000E6872EB|nr:MULTISPECIES: hypothetical protein [Allomuricauda]MDC6384017.1 hypothetical protein [Muricauda sp. SK9]RIV48625.1 hypothetical protein D2V93_16635 [Allomuricauda taeanensis]